MKKISLYLAAAITASGSASAAPYFHTDFDEATLADIVGLNIDTPNTAGADSGTVVLNTVDQKLDMTADGANLWTDREGAPIAWVAAPTVELGDTWFVETQITHVDDSGGNSTYDQAGITFYSGTAGANPGSENTGTDQSLLVGISDWNSWDHRVQGFSDNNPNVAAPATDGDDTFEYRVEITEGGDFDIYNFFYREDPADAWTQMGDPDLSLDFENSAVGLFIKSHNNNPTASTQFDYLTIDIVPAVSNTDLQVQSLEYDTDTEMITLTWNSNTGATYEVYYGTDLITFGSPIGDPMISQGAGTTSVTFANPVIGAPKLFFRVVEN